MRRCVFLAQTKGRREKERERKRKGKEEEGKGRGGKGEREREIGSEALADTEKSQTPQPGIEHGTPANAADALQLSHRDKRYHQPVCLKFYRGRRPHNALLFPDVEHCAAFIKSCSEEFGLPHPAPLHGRAEMPPVYLPASKTNKSVHAEYVAACQTMHRRAAGISVFRSIWRSCFPHINLLNPWDVLLRHGDWRCATEDVLLRPGLAWLQWSRTSFRCAQLNTDVDSRTHDESLCLAKKKSCR